MFFCISIVFNSSEKLFSSNSGSSSLSSIFSFLKVNKSFGSAWNFNFALSNSFTSTSSHWMSSSSFLSYLSFLASISSSKSLTSPFVLLTLLRFFPDFLLVSLLCELKLFCGLALRINLNLRNKIIYFTLEMHCSL